MKDDFSPAPLLINNKTEDSNYEESSEDRPITCIKRYFGPIKSGSLRGSTVAMASITFGGGCLAFPFVIAQCGPVIGLIIFLMAAGASYYTLKLLLDEGVKSGIMDYNSLLQHATGPKMVFFSDINNLILCIGVIMSYQLTVYKFALQLLNKYFDVDPDDSVNKIILMTSCFFAQVTLCMMKNISSLQYASIVGTFALIYSIFVIVVEMFFYLHNYLDAGNKIILFQPISWNYLDTFATFMFGFSSHNGIYQIFMELKRPSEDRYNKVLFRSFSIEVILYLLIAFCGYFSTFEKTKDVFLERDDLPGFDDYFINIAKITLFICLHCSMAINYNIMRMSFKTMFFGNKTPPFVKDFMLVVGIIALANVCVYFISDVTQILGVIGGLCTIVICFINPIMIHLKLSGDKISKFDKYFALTILITVTVLGSSATVKSIISFFLPKNKVLLL